MAHHSDIPERRGTVSGTSCRTRRIFCSWPRSWRGERISSPPARTSTGRRRHALVARGRADRGVRTRCSDDLTSGCPGPSANTWTRRETTRSERAGPGGLGPLAPKPSRYEPARYDGRRRRCWSTALALRLVIRRGVGEHGLPLMLAGTGSMDTVRIEGREESVWLAWFFAHTARRFAAVLDRQGDRHGAALCCPRPADGPRGRQGLGRGLVSARLVRLRRAPGVTKGGAAG